MDSEINLLIIPKFVLYCLWKEYHEANTLDRLQQIPKKKWSKSLLRQLELKGVQFTVSDKLVHSKSPQNAYSMKISLRAHCLTIQINSSCAILFAIVDRDNLKKIAFSLFCLPAQREACLQRELCQNATEITDTNS